MKSAISLKRLNMSLRDKILSFLKMEHFTDAPCTLQDLSAVIIVMCMFLNYETKWPDL